LLLEVPDGEALASLLEEELLAILPRISGVLRDRKIMLSTNARVGDDVVDVA